MQGNEAVRPIFRAWLAPFASMDASTLTLSNTGGTDHQSFDGIGLPAFQFIQDPLEYDTRTHHTTMDTYERVSEEDVKQAAIIMAVFAYDAAMREGKFRGNPLFRRWDHGDSERRNSQKLSTPNSLFANTSMHSRAGKDKMCLITITQKQPQRWAVFVLRMRRTLPATVRM